MYFMYLTYISGMLLYNYRIIKFLLSKIYSKHILLLLLLNLLLFLQDVLYLTPLVDEVVKEREEKERWNLE